ncbi:MAG: universal stress protein [Flavobacteriaceae bacterium]
MKKVAILTDFSKCAWNALFTALKLFQDSEVLFYIVHCYEPSFGAILGDRSKERLAIIYESLSADSNRQLDEMDAYLKKHHKKKAHLFEKRSLRGNLIYNISQMLIQDDIELIVMGQKGVTGASDVIMGSNTKKVIKKIRDCPILAVPEAKDFKDLDRIMFPTDLTRRIRKCQVRLLIEMSEAWNSNLTVLQVTQEPALGEDQEKNKQKLIEALKGVDISFMSVEMKQDLNASISTAVKEDKSDLIVLIHYAHTFLERLIREPVVKKMAFHSDVPLLVLPQKDC